MDVYAKRNIWLHEIFRLRERAWNCAAIKVKADCMQNGMHGQAAHASACVIWSAAKSNWRIPAADAVASIVPLQPEIRDIHMYPGYKFAAGLSGKLKYVKILVFTARTVEALWWRALSPGLDVFLKTYGLTAAFSVGVLEMACDSMRTLLIGARLISVGVVVSSQITKWQANSQTSKQTNS